MRYSTSRQSVSMRPAKRPRTGRARSRRRMARAAGVQRDDAIGARNAREVEIVDAHDARSPHVDHLPVEHVAGEQQLAVAALEAADVHGSVRSDLAGPELGHAVDGDEEVPPARAGDEAGDERVSALLVPGDDVLDARDALALALDDRQATISESGISPTPTSAVAPWAIVTPAFGSSVLPRSGGVYGALCRAF